MKTYLTKLIIIVSLFAMAIPASAAIACAGKVTNAYTDLTGTFGRAQNNGRHGPTF